MSEWQPIETATKEQVADEHILVGNAEGAYNFGFWSDWQGKIDWDDEYYSSIPTHWKRIDPINS